MGAAAPVRRPEQAAKQRRFYAGAFAYAGFRWFFCGLVLLSLGVVVGDVGQRWLVQELTGSPFDLGLISFSLSFPILLLSLPAGVLADRVDRVKLIAVSRSAGAVFSLLLAGLTAAQLVQVWHVALVAFLWGVTAALEIPGRNALFPNLISRADLMHAVAIYSGVWSCSTIAGPAIAGWLIIRLGIGGCFYLSAALQLLAVIAFMQVKRYLPRQDDGRAKEQPWKAFLGGVGYMRTDRVILGLLVLALLPAVFGQTAMMTLLPSFAAGVLSGDASTYSFLLTAAGVGALGANVALALKASLEGKGRLLAGFGIAFGAGLVVFALTTSLPVSLPVLALVGAMNSCFMTLVTTLVQGQVDDEMRGRVMSAFMLTWGMTSFGSLFIGFLGSNLGVQAAVAAGGALTLLSVIGTIARVPELARLR